MIYAGLQIGTNSNIQRQQEQHRQCFLQTIVTK